MIRIIGVGPGNPAYLSQYALELIKNANYILAFERIAEDLGHINPNIRKVSKVDEAADLLKDTDSGILLASGDALFFGIGELVKAKGIDVGEIVPGISSVQYLYNRLGRSYSTNRTYSVHGRDFDFKVLRPGGLYSFLIDQKRGANYISKELAGLGHRGQVIAGYNLSYDDEEIIYFSIGETIKEVSSLGVVVVKLENT